MPEYMTPDLWIRGGLLDPKHCAAMGDAVWVYLHLHGLVRFDGEGAGRTAPDRLYHHEAAAEALGLSLRTVKRHLDRLVRKGYVTVERRQHGLDVTITNYRASRDRATARRLRSATSDTSNMESSAKTGTTDAARGASVGTPEVPEPPRSATPDTSDGAQKCQILSAEVPNLVTRSATSDTSVIRTRAANVSNESNDTPPLGSPRPANDKSGRPLTPLQLVVNSWMEAIGRDPFAAKDFARHVGAGSELVRLKRSPEDVAACTRWMLSQPWRMARGKPPTLDEVRDGMRQWIDLGRPPVFREAPRGNGPVSAVDVQEALYQRHLAEAAGPSRPALPGPRRLLDG